MFFCLKQISVLFREFCVPINLRARLRRLRETNMSLCSSVKTKFCVIPSILCAIIFDRRTKEHIVSSTTSSTYTAQKKRVCHTDTPTLYIFTSLPQRFILPKLRESHCNNINIRELSKKGHGIYKKNDPRF